MAEEIVIWTRRWEQVEGWATHDLVATTENREQWDVGDRDGDVGQGQGRSGKDADGPCGTPPESYSDGTSKKKKDSHYFRKKTAVSRGSMRSTQAGKQ